MHVTVFKMKITHTFSSNTLWRQVLKPTEAWWCLYISPLIQVMVWCRFSTKPLPKSMLPYCQLVPLEWISVKLESKYATESIIFKSQLFCSIRPQHVNDNLTGNWERNTLKKKTPQRRLVYTFVYWQVDPHFMLTPIPPLADASKILIHLPLLPHICVGELGTD